MKEYGYEWKAYPVLTLDGWELVLFHITGVFDEIDGKTYDIHFEGKPPVLFMHEQRKSALDWLVAQDGKPTMFELVDAGYDVWLGNNRVS